MKFKFFKILPIIFSSFLISCYDFSNENLYKNSELKKVQANLAYFYSELPNLSNCFAGSLKNTEKIKALNKVNHIRSLHNLPKVIYKKEDDKLTTASALLSAANVKLSHLPAKSWRCFSQNAKKGSATSNLYLNVADTYLKVANFTSTYEHIVSFLIDYNVEDLGHRRWILDPFLKYISYGRVDLIDEKASGAYRLVSASSLKVIYSEYASLAEFDQGFIAYPYGDYPSEYVNKDWFLSFSVLANKYYKGLNYNIVYADAEILVKNSDGDFLQIKDQAFDNDAYGLRNILRWRLEKLLKNHTYYVTIKNVKVRGVSKSYSYEFKLL